jgi:L-ascorbate metabolism protein UlaG (beta-lactamase superfamily)
MPQLETPLQLMNAIWKSADTDLSGTRDPGLN